MRIPEAERLIQEADGDTKVFWKWMQGQTCSIDEEGYTDVYDGDVKRFIRYKCNPKNEPFD